MWQHITSICFPHLSALTALLPSRLLTHSRERAHTRTHTHTHTCAAPARFPLLHTRSIRSLSLASSIDMYNNDVGKKSAQKFMKQTGDLKAATLYFAS